MTYLSADTRVAQQYDAMHRDRPAFTPMGLADALSIQRDEFDNAPDQIAGYERDLMVYLAGMTDKVDDAAVIADAEANGGMMCAAAIVWACRQYGAQGEACFAYTREMAQQLTRRNARGLSAGQVRGLLNCMRAEAIRDAARLRDLIGDAEPFTDASPALVPAAQTVTPPAQTAPQTGLDLSKVPSGLYAIPGGTTDLRVKIDNLTDDTGKWAGWVFVKDGNPYGMQARYGSQRPGQRYSGKIEEQLQVIMADPTAAMQEYGRITGTCGRCGRDLTDETSKAMGIGPICQQAMGL